MARAAASARGGRGARAPGGARGATPRSARARAPTRPAADAHAHRRRAGSNPDSNSAVFASHPRRRAAAARAGRRSPARTGRRPRDSEGVARGARRTCWREVQAPGRSLPAFHALCAQCADVLARRETVHGLLDAAESALPEAPPASHRRRRAAACSAAAGRRRYRPGVAEAGARGRRGGGPARGRGGETAHRAHHGAPAPRGARRGHRRALNAPAAELKLRERGAFPEFPGPGPAACSSRHKDVHRIVT